MDVKTYCETMCNACYESAKLHQSLADKFMAIGDNEQALYHMDMVSKYEMTGLNWLSLMIKT